MRTKYVYDGKELTVTQILQEPGVSELWNKLHRKLKVGGINKEMIDEYLEQQRQNGRNPFIILPRPQGSVEVNGERMTAKQALNRFSLLIKEKSLYAKFLRDFRNGDIPEYILYEESPQFHWLNDHFGGARIRFRLDDQRIKYRNLESLFDFLKPQTLELIRANPNTKVGLSVSPWMVKRSGENFIRMLKGLFKYMRRILYSTVVHF